MIKRHSFVVLLAFLFGFGSIANAAPAVIHVDSIPNQLSLDTTWEFHAEDDMQWAQPSYNDNSWATVFSDLSAKHGGDKFNGIGWFRIHLKVAPALFNRTFILDVSQYGASQVYLNGKQIYKFGVVSSSPQNEVPDEPSNSTYFIEFGRDTNQVIAVRYSAWAALQKKIPKPGFEITIKNLSLLNAGSKNRQIGESAGMFIFAVFLVVSLFHLLLFLFYHKNRSNLYFSLLSAALAIMILCPVIAMWSSNPFIGSTIQNLLLYLVTPFFLFIVLSLYSIFSIKFSWYFWVIVALAVIADVSIFVIPDYFAYAIFTSIATSSIESSRVSFNAVRNKKPGSWIMAASFGLFSITMYIIITVFAVTLLIHGSHSVNVNVDSNPLLVVLFVIWGVSGFFGIPISMSVYLAGDFARTNKSLALQLVHVKQLAEQNILKEQEKQQIIEGQKEMLEKQVKEKTAEIQEQKDELEEKNKEITDSITYARRIQTAILPPEEMLADALGDHVVIYKPKDVVSGDFYWSYLSGDNVVFAVADCTGHGVPGAFMSMIGNSILNEVVQDRKVLEADLILNELRSTLITTLQKSGGQTTRDGMDIALCVWNKKNNTLQYAGANNPLYWISENIAKDGSIKEAEKIRLYNNHLLEIVADKQPIGYQEGKMDVPFTKHIIQLRKGDTIYITSDGYIDQFGGEKNKKFTSKRFRDMLDTFVYMPTVQQKLVLEQTIEQWKRYETQTDDICVIGVRV